MYLDRPPAIVRLGTRRRADEAARLDVGELCRNDRGNTRIGREQHRDRLAVIAAQDKLIAVEPRNHAMQALSLLRRDRCGHEQETDRQRGESRGGAA